MPELGFEAEIKVSWTKEVGEDAQQRYQSEQRKEKMGATLGIEEFSSQNGEGKGGGWEGHAV